MSTLHTVNKSPFEKRSLEQCLSRATAGGSLLLIEDAVSAALASTAFEAQLVAASDTLKLYVLEPDMVVRGLNDAPLVPGVVKVDYSGFVELVTTHDRVHSWL